MSILVLSTEEKIKSLKEKRAEIDRMIEHYTEQLDKEKPNDLKDTVNGQIEEDI